MLALLLLAAPACDLDFDKPPIFDRHADGDGDGLAYDEETRLGTDPNQADTDGDRLSDGREAELGTDPLQRDTDGDGLSDWAEVGEGQGAALDTDADGVIDALEPNRDTDGDRVPEWLDGPGDGGDLDGDDVLNGVDLCRETPDPDQEDLDLDELGDACDPDDDNDQVPDATDDCPRVANPGQEDLDGDGLGDLCDEDTDGDEVVDELDTCPRLSNPGAEAQADLDGDRLGDLCDPDDDGDRVDDEVDTCPRVPNLRQEDADEDGEGDLCDEDLDGDEVPNDTDSCPLDPNPDQADRDGDRIGDLCEGAVWINEGAAFTAQARVRLTLAFVRVAELRWSLEDGSASRWIPWEDPDRDGRMVLGGDGEEEVVVAAGDSSDDGSHTVYVQTRDAAGQASGARAHQASIVLDTHPPTEPSLRINEGALYTNTSTGLVALQLAATDEHGVAWTWVQGVAGPPAPLAPPEFQPAGRRGYTPQAVVPLPAFDEDGVKTLWARFEDPAGNLSAPTLASIVLDRSPPVVRQLVLQAPDGTLCAEAQPCLLRDSRVRLVLQEGFDPAEGASDIDAVWVSVDDPVFGGGGWQAYAPAAGSNVGEIVWDLPQEDREYVLRMLVRDRAGNVVGVGADERLELRVVLDTTPPPQPVAQAPARVRTPEVLLSSSNLAGVAALQVSWDPDFGQLVERRPPQAEERIPLPRPGADPEAEVPEGPYELRLRYVDPAGNVGPVRTLGVTYDATGPQGVSISSQAASPTRLDTVRLLLHAPQAARMRISSGPGCEGGQWEPFASEVVRPLFGEGPQVFSVVFEDAAGNPSDCVQATIVRDSQAPEGVSVTIGGPAVHVGPEGGEDAARFASSTSVVLRIAAPPEEGVTTMRITHAAEWGDEPIRPFEAQVAWILDGAADGEQQVKVQLFDAAGNDTVVSDSVILDTRPPSGVSLELADGTRWTTVPLVSVRATAMDEGTRPELLRVELSNDPLFQTSTVLPPLPEGGWGRSDWALSSGDGEKAVYLRVTDLAGHGTVRRDTIELDTLPPLGISLQLSPSVQLGDELLVGERQVTLEVRGQEVHALRVDDGGATPAALQDDDGTFEWIPAQPSIDLTLTGEDGPKPVVVSLRDEAGNEAVSALTITPVLDTQPPEAVSLAIEGPDVVGAGGTLYARSSRVELRLAGADVHGVTRMRASNSLPIEGLPFEAFVSRLPWQLDDRVQGERTVWVQLSDPLGNVATASAAVVLDTLPPEVGTVALAGGAGWTGSLQVPLEVQTFEEGLVVRVAGPIAEQGTHAGAAFPLLVTLQDVPEGEADAERIVSVVVVDPAGNEAAPRFASVRLDRQPPEQGCVLVADGRAAVNTRTLPVSVRDTDPDTMAIWEVAQPGPEALPFCAPPGCDEPNDEPPECGDPPCEPDCTQPCERLACDDPRFVPFAPASTVTLGAGLGPKTLCWRFCDAAGNGSAPGWAELHLDTYVPRPTPVLQAITPPTYVAFSPNTTVRVHGCGFAADTQVHIDDFVTECQQEEPAAAGCQVLSQEPCGQGCASDCVFELPAEITANSGTYVVRLYTPDPVEGGVGTSAQTRFLSVVAPVPQLEDLDVLPGAPDTLSPACLRGDLVACEAHRGYHTLRYLLEDPEPRDAAVLLTGRRLMGNVMVRLGNAYGQVLAVEPGPGPQTGEQKALVLLTEVSLPAQEEPYDIFVENPPPGGGDAGTAIGVNWGRRTGAGDILSVLRETDIIAREPGRFSELHAPGESAAGVLTVEEGFAPCPLTPGAELKLRDPAGELLLAVSDRARPTGLPWGTQVGTLELSGAAGPVAAARACGERLVPDGSFGEITHVDAGNYVWTVAPGDLNGDGEVDLAVVEEGVTILLGRGDGAFDAAPAIPRLGEGPSAAAVGDLDRDGALDLAVVYAGSDEVRVLMGAGDGSFIPRPESVPVGVEPYAVEVADLNADGWLDLLVAGFQSHDVAVMLGQGDGTFVPLGRLEMGSAPIALEVADFNGDRLPDLAVASLSAGHVGVALGLGDGRFGAAAPYAVGHSPRWVSAGDVDGDEVLDLVTANTGHDDVSVLLGLGDGTFGQQQRYPAGVDPAAAALGDVDGDGDLDMVVSNITSNDVSLLMGRGDGSFEAQQRLPAGTNPRCVALHDVDRDGAQDLLVCNGADGDLGVRLGRGRPSQGFVQRLATGAQPMAAVAGDFDRDGRLDLAVANQVGSVSVALGLEDGSWNPLPPHGVPGDAYGLAAGDLDGDGRVDLAVLGYQSAQLTPLFGRGDGTFAEGDGVPLPSWPLFVGLGDLSGDGVLDLAILCGRSDDVVVRLGRGDGSFLPLTRHAAGRTPIRLAMGDVDGDGGLDLVVANWSDSDLSVLLGSGAGTFQAQWRQQVGQSPVDVLIGDFSGDGREDLAAALQMTNELVVMPGTGVGSFGVGSRYPAGTGPYRVLSGDLDGGGSPDLIVPSFSPDYLSVFNNAGDGSFTGSSAQAYEHAPYDLAVLDVNRDGALDIVLVDFLADELKVLLSPVSPDLVRQTLRDLPLATLVVPAGASTFTVHQALQDLAEVHVDLALRFSAEPQGTVTTSLLAPDGETQVQLGAHDAFEPWPPDEPTAWRLILHYPRTPTAPDPDALAELRGLQPAGDWTLVVDNATGVTGELVDFAVITRGRLIQPTRGDEPERPERLVLPPIPEGRDLVARSLPGTTLGFTDHAELDCADTAASPDRWYELTLDAPGTLDIKAVAAFDAVLELREGACGAEQAQVLGCDDNGLWGRSPALGSLVGVELPAGTYCLIVDGVREPGDPGVGGGAALHAGEYRLRVLLGRPQQ